MSGLPSGSGNDRVKVRHSPMVQADCVGSVHTSNQWTPLLDRWIRPSLIERSLVWLARIRTSRMSRSVPAPKSTPIYCPAPVPPKLNHAVPAEKIGPASPYVLLIALIASPPNPPVVYSLLNRTVLPVVSSLPSMGVPVTTDISNSPMQT